MSLAPPSGSVELAVGNDDLDDLVGAVLEGRAAATGERSTYSLERRLGGGGQACVFLAKRRAASAEDAVVVKIWRPSFVAAEPAIASLVLTKESVALAQLRDRVPPTPYVVGLVDDGEARVRLGRAAVTLPWLALEYVHGGALGTNLQERVSESLAKSGTAFSPARARRVLRSIVEGMIAIHEVGVIHRDLKPTNILVCGVGDDELAKVADFGLARAVGMHGTFGVMAVGTPGYASPEQMDGTKAGPWSDVFSLAAVAYYVIAGEDMFQGPAMVRLANVFNGTFESIGTRRGVHPGFKIDDVIARLDAVLRSATKRELSLRVPSVHELWTALDPILRDAESDGRASRDLMSASTLNDAASQPWSFHVTHAPQGAIELRAAAFDPDGHGLGAARGGLLYWEGTRWLPVGAPAGIDVGAIRSLRRLAPQRWFACGDRGFVAVFTPQATIAAQQILDGRFELTTSSVVSERQFIVAGRVPGAPSVLVAFVDGAWRPPVAIPFAAAITALAPAGPSAWFATGIDPEGKGLFFCVSLRGADAAIERWPIDSAGLHACAVDRQGIAFAVGAGGFAFRKGVGHPSLERVLSHRDLTVCAFDPAGTGWAAASGRLVTRPRGETGTWSQAWSSPEWACPFVGIGAMAGMILAAASDGSVVVGHQGLSLR